MNDIIQAAESTDDGNSERCAHCSEPATRHCSECNAGVCNGHSEVVGAFVFCKECIAEGRADDVRERQGEPGSRAG